MYMGNFNVFLNGSYALAEMLSTGNFISVLIDASSN
jgi:hypothetical protein